MLRYLPFVLILAVWIYAFIDCLNTPEDEVRKLPKWAWVIIILLFGQVLLGPIVWFVVGRPRKNAPYGATKPNERRWVAPDDNPDFLNSLGKQKRWRPGDDDRPAAGESTGGDPTASAEGVGGLDAEAEELRREELRRQGESTGEREGRDADGAGDERGDRGSDDPGERGERTGEKREDSHRRDNGGPTQEPPSGGSG